MDKLRAMAHVGRARQHSSKQLTMNDSVGMAAIVAAKHQPAVPFVWLRCISCKAVQKQAQHAYHRRKQTLTME